MSSYISGAFSRGAARPRGRSALAGGAVQRGAAERPATGIRMDEVVVHFNPDDEGVVRSLPPSLTHSLPLLFRPLPLSLQPIRINSRG